MPKKAKSLSALAVSRLKAPGLHSVGSVDGLALQVTQNGARSWVLRLMVAGKRREMGLGGFPSTTLAGACEAARAARAKVREGVDPVHERKALQSALIAARAGEKTFAECAAACIAAKEPEWKNVKHAAQWRSTLDQFANPVLGSLLVRDIENSHILAVLEPIWRTKTETASRVRGRIKTVLDWACAAKFRSGLNPARWEGNLDQLLAAPKKIAKVKHHRALPYAQVGEFMRALHAQAGIAARALEFLILTAARSGEVRGATWAEFDLDAALWKVPAGRMKADIEHKVPLPAPAVKILRGMPRFAGCKYVFASPRHKQFSDMALLQVVRRMNVDCVVHGFRSSFRDWAAECTNFPREIAEASLAHALDNKTEAAYLRSDFFEKRRLMMAQWATYCARPAQSATVTPINRRRAVK